MAKSRPTFQVDTPTAIVFLVGLVVGLLVGMAVPSWRDRTINANERRLNEIKSKIDEKYKR